MTMFWISRSYCGNVSCFGTGQENILEEQRKYFTSGELDKEEMLLECVVNFLCRTEMGLIDS